jgi:thiamine-phosphate pyrophosphorylase
MPLCGSYGCTLVVNDDWRLALELEVDAVHVGSEDGDVEEVREAVGPEVILGVSCYADLERAKRLAPLADYLAFGSFFPSRTKPAAASATLEVFAPARMLDRPTVAIGGIDGANAPCVVEAGADAVAVISAVFGEAAMAKATSDLISTIARCSANL